eukprot:gene28-320_t
MSTDPAILSALATVSQQDLRYFELVTLRFLGRQRKCYLCIGKHALFFCKKDVSQLIRGGEIFYAHIESVVADAVDSGVLMLVLNDNRPAEWESPRLFVVSENRYALVQHLQCCWTVDYMWRYGQPAVFPRYDAPLSQQDGAADEGGKEGETGDAGTVDVAPFTGYRRQAFSNYRFFLKAGHVEVPSVLQKTDTGHYRDPGPKRFEVILHVHEPVAINALPQLDREHIRWVALEYKKMLTEHCDQRYYMLINSSYLKKMNLADDIAQWLCWQMLIKTRQHILVLIFLRRKYIPPLMSTAQDVVLMLKCPNFQAQAIASNTSNNNDDTSNKDSKNNGSTGGGGGAGTPSKGLKSPRRSGSSKRKKPKVPTVTDDELLAEAQLVADSLSPVERDFTVYRDMVQAKLDSLRFDEDGYRWVENHLKLLPNQRECGKSFVRSILQLLQDGGTLDNAALLTDPEVAFGRRCEAWAGIPIDADPLRIVDAMMNGAEGIPDDPPVVDKHKPGGHAAYGAETDEEAGQVARTRNLWRKRLARYLAYCVDGGICGSKFTLHDLIDAKISGDLPRDTERTITRVIEFLLHLRRSNFELPFEDVSVLRQLQDDLKGWEFNERVMQILLESDYLRKLFGRDEQGALDHAACCARRVVSPGVFTSLKAAVCRQILQAENLGAKSIQVLAPALVEVLRMSSSYYVQTCATAALVNLSAQNDQIKNLLMSSGVTPLLIQQVLLERADPMVLLERADPMVADTVEKSLHKPLPANFNGEIRLEDEHPLEAVRRLSPLHPGNGNLLQLACCLSAGVFSARPGGLSDGGVFSARPGEPYYAGGTLLDEGMVGVGDGHRNALDPDSILQYPRLARHVCCLLDGVNLLDAG